MGLFDRLAGVDSVRLTPKSALALAAMTVIGADGIIEEEEVDNLRRIVRGDDDAFQRAFKVYKAKSFHDCIPMVAEVLDQQQKIATMANLLDIAMADGILAGAEEELLQAYAEQFAIPGNILDTLIDVIARKNDFSIF